MFAIGGGRFAAQRRTFCLWVGMDDHERER